MIFDANEKERIRRTLRAAEGFCGVEVLTYALLDNHFHLSEFAKTLKQRVSQSYNRRHGRKGTLWEERFKSILVQGQDGHGALSTIAAYIDLNPVRAGLVDDPKAYRFSGYGEAVGGSRSVSRIPLDGFALCG